MRILISVGEKEKAKGAASPYFQAMLSAGPVEMQPAGLEDQQAGGRGDAAHTVTVAEPDSNLRAAFAGNCRVNSLHHQAIRRLGRGLKVTAHAEDGLIEAIEAAENYPFL